MDDKIESGGMLNAQDYMGHGGAVIYKDVPKRELGKKVGMPEYKYVPTPSTMGVAFVALETRTPPGS